MDSIGKITLKNNRHDNERIGELKRQKHADESLKIEEIVENFLFILVSLFQL